MVLSALLRSKNVFDKDPKIGHCRHSRTGICEVAGVRFPDIRPSVVASLVTQGQRDMPSTVRRSINGLVPSVRPFLRPSSSAR